MLFITVQETKVDTTHVDIYKAVHVDNYVTSKDLCTFIRGLNAQMEKVVQEHGNHIKLSAVILNVHTVKDEDLYSLETLAHVGIRRLADEQ